MQTGSMLQTRVTDYLIYKSPKSGTIRGVCSCLFIVPQATNGSMLIQQLMAWFLSERPSAYRLKNLCSHKIASHLFSGIELFKNPRAQTVWSALASLLNPFWHVLCWLLCLFAGLLCCLLPIYVNEGLINQQTRSKSGSRLEGVPVILWWHLTQMPFPEMSSYSVLYASQLNSPELKTKWWMCFCLELHLSIALWVGLSLEIMVTYWSSIHKQSPSVFIFRPIFSWKKILGSGQSCELTVALIDLRFICISQ